MILPKKGKAGKQRPLCLLLDSSNIINDRLSSADAPIILKRNSKKNEKKSCLLRAEVGVRIVFWQWGAEIGNMATSAFNAAGVGAGTFFQNALSAPPPTYLSYYAQHVRTR